MLFSSLQKPLGEITASKIKSNSFWEHLTLEIIAMTQHYLIHEMIPQWFAAGILFSEWSERRRISRQWTIPRERLLCNCSEL